MTREEAVKELKELRNEWSRHIYSEGVKKQISLDMAIKTLEQEPILGKIKAEIKALSPEPTSYDVVDGNPIKDAIWETLIEVDKIIDKYKAESEEEK